MDPTVAVLVGLGLALALVAVVAGLVVWAFTTGRGYLEPAIELAKHEQADAERALEQRTAELEELKAAREREGAEDRSDVAWVRDLDRADAGGDDDALWDELLSDEDDETTAGGAGDRPEADHERADPAVEG